MARSPQQSQNRTSTPTSQGYVAGGSAPGLAGDAGWEIGRLRADIDNLKDRVATLETETKEVKTFHTGVKYIGSAVVILLAILSYFISDDLKTLLEMADTEQVHKSDDEAERQKLLLAPKTEGRTVDELTSKK